MKELLLVVTIAGERVALPAAAVESVVELDTLTPVPRAAPHVAGLSALRSRVLTVIDCMRSLELGDTDCSDGIREAAVVEVDGHHYALIVDLVEDVVEAQSDPQPVREAEGEAMRLKDIRRRESADLQQEVRRLREQMFQKRFHGHSEDKGDRGLIRKSRRDVARILTVLGQRSVEGKKA